MARLAAASRFARADPSPEVVSLPACGLRLVCHDEAKLREDWPERINRHASDLSGHDQALDLFAPDRIWDYIVGPVLVISERVMPDRDSVELSVDGLTNVRCWLASGQLEPEGLGVR